MRWLTTLALVGALSVLAACTPDHEALCESLKDDCDAVVEVEDCIEDGERVTSAAEDAQCDAQLDSYLGCLELDVCTWDTRCTAERIALEDCSGAFPDF